MTDQQEPRPDLLGSRSSPFDHHASFVALPSDNRKEGARQEDRAPKPIATIDLTEQEVPPATPLTIGHPGHKQLAEAMEYRMRVANVRDTTLLRADALTLIEKLTAGKPLTKRPREMRRADVHLKLQKIIPPKYFVTDETAHVQYDTGILNPTDILATAAARYIIDLKLSGSQKTHSKAENGSGVGRAPPKEPVNMCESHEEEDVEKTLANLEAWCDGLLDEKKVIVVD